MDKVNNKASDDHNEDFVEKLELLRDMFQGGLGDLGGIAGIGKEIFPGNSQDETAPRKTDHEKLNEQLISTLKDISHNTREIITLININNNHQQQVKEILSKLVAEK